VIARDWTGADPPLLGEDDRDLRVVV